MGTGIDSVMTVASQVQQQQQQVDHDEGVEVTTVVPVQENEIVFVAAQEEDENDSPQEEPSVPVSADDASSRGYCGCGYDNVAMAKGISLLGTARGPIVMSNIFLSTALIYLASEQVGCLETTPEGETQVVEDCEERVYGVFSPAALITNIAVISGLLAACLMPIAGAIVDYTAHRWTTGVVSALLITIIQIIQIATNSSNWFPMAILQAVAGCFYQIQVLATWAYLPDIARQVNNETTMTRFTSNFTMVQFTAQAAFLFLVVAISTTLNLTDVNTGRLSQAMNSLGIVVSFKWGWTLLPIVPARQSLLPQKNLLWQGFLQNWNTAQKINREYRNSLRWFLLGILFAEPAANAFTVVAVVFLNEQLGMGGNDIGIFFGVVLVAMVPGGLIFHGLTLRTDPNTALRVSMLLMFLLVVVGALVLTPDNVFPIAYIWGLAVGLILGCFYPCQQLFYSFVVPRGQEAEFTGFYVYCTQLLVWLPPLVFSTMVEAHVDQRIGLIVVGSFFLISIAIFSMAPPFDELLLEVHSNDKNRLSFRGLDDNDAFVADNTRELSEAMVSTDTKDDGVEHSPVKQRTGNAIQNNEAGSVPSEDNVMAPSSNETSGSQDDESSDDPSMDVKCQVLLSGRLRIPASDRPKAPKRDQETSE
ncbi:expressed unknown protein [Seminavis robusta]|uniref:Uncharacterized protein n=1 Tax=Seminavis robusta TaxID=568900 RepID=A0A9N8EGR2_9STRA|nr:expressed unknown protein [Seminavis robusta]|eukprot:Sro1139_g245430.2  (646) ;mRNA; r:11719-13656